MKVTSTKLPDEPLKGDRDYWPLNPAPKGVKGVPHPVRDCLIFEVSSKESRVFPRAHLAGIESSDGIRVEFHWPTATVVVFCDSAATLIQAILDQDVSVLVALFTTPPRAGAQVGPWSARCEYPEVATVPFIQVLAPREAREVTQTQQANPVPDAAHKPQA
jgi:hypothetical protein